MRAPEIQSKISGIRELACINENKYGFTTPRPSVFMPHLSKNEENVLLALYNMFNAFTNNLLASVSVINT